MLVRSDRIILIRGRSEKEETNHLSQEEIIETISQLHRKGQKRGEEGKEERKEGRLLRCENV